MILVDAIYINNSGGKILLDYLIINLEKSNTKINESSNFTPAEKL